MKWKLRLQLCVHIYGMPWRRDGGKRVVDFLPSCVNPGLQNYIFCGIMNQVY